MKQELDVKQIKLTIKSIDEKIEWIAKEIIKDIKKDVILNENMRAFLVRLEKDRKHYVSLLNQGDSS